MISAIVFIYWPEEEDHFEVCLKTLSFVDEILVVDNGATAKTLEIAKKYKCQIIKTPSKSFSERHNLGAHRAKGDWLLFIDADERLSQELQHQIALEIAHPTADAYELNRVNFYLGKKVRFGDRYPDYVARLFKKTSLKEWSGEIHESSSVQGKIGRLSAPLYHLTHREIFLMMDKTKNFAEIEAKIRYEAGHPPIVGWRLVRVFVTELYNRIVRLQGWRQGTEGWIDGIFQAFSMFIVYARLWEKQRQPSLEETYKEIDRKILAGEEI